jgi:hypothetical protein
MATAIGALKALNFGEVDSESEPDLERRFVRTEDFDRFLNPHNVIILGPKGSGKSALFEMFAKHLPSTHKLAGDRLSNVLIGTGTGFGDLTELTTTDIQSFQKLPSFDYASVWKLYIALKLAMEISRLGYNSEGPLRDFLRATRRVRDYRIGPMMSSAWCLIAGNAPSELQINVMGTGATIRSGRATLDVLDLLADMQRVLALNNRRMWLLFDKIDEIYPTDPAERDRALEGLFPACMAIQRSFPNIVPRIFIRSDLYGPQLQFTNKSHLVGKQFEIEWDAPALRLLLIKRAQASSQEVRDYLGSIVTGLASRDPESLSNHELATIFQLLFDERAYPGKNEAKTLTWMIARATDAKGGTFPRELISYGNIAKEFQLAKGGPSETSLISGRSVVDAYYQVSRIRCETYLSEFPHLRAHIRKFRGKHDAPFTRAELLAMFAGLTPEPDEAIDELHEVGVLAPEGRVDASVASSFDIPRLYRAGLGLSIIARP